MPVPTLETSIQTKQRRPRYRRVGVGERPALNLTDRDRELLKHIYDHRFITAAMLQDLVEPPQLTQRQQEAVARLIAARRARASRAGESGEPPTRTRREIQRRLQALYHHGYVERHKLSDHDPIVYALGNRGADEITLHYGIDRKKIDWTSKNRETHERYIHHTLMVSRFRHALTLTLRTRPGAGLTYWELSGSFKVSTKYQEERMVRDREGERTAIVDVPVTVIPDAYFCLQDGQDSMYFFLEADRSTMTNDRFCQKLVSYYKFWQYEIYRKPENRYQLPSFRVLTLTISKERRDNLRAVARTVDDKQRGTGLFWFLCEKDYQDTPERLFEPLWQTARDDRMRGLLEDS